MTSSGSEVCSVISVWRTCWKIVINVDANSFILFLLQKTSLSCLDAQMLRLIWVDEHSIRCTQSARKVRPVYLEKKFTSPTVLRRQGECFFNFRFNRYFQVKIVIFITNDLIDFCIMRIAKFLSSFLTLPTNFSVTSYLLLLLTCTLAIVLLHLNKP